MRQYLLTRSAYGPGWTVEANARRLAMSRGITIRSIAAQASHDFTWLVLLHPADPLQAERMAAYRVAHPETRFLYLDADGSASSVAFQAYRAGWADEIGARDETIAMTRLDDDDGLAPWAMGKIGQAAAKARKRIALMLPIGVRAWQGRYTVVRHNSNAMQTLVTLPGDAMTVYDYGHRFVRRVAPVHVLDNRPGWLWARHDDTISGWRTAGRPIIPEIRALFDVDWSLFGQPRPHPRPVTGQAFR